MLNRNGVGHRDSEIICAHSIAVFVVLAAVCDKLHIEDPDFLDGGPVDPDAWEADRFIAMKVENLLDRKSVV